MSTLVASPAFEEERKQQPASPPTSNDTDTQMQIEESSSSKRKLKRKEPQPPPTVILLTKPISLQDDSHRTTIATHAPPQNTPSIEPYSIQEPTMGADVEMKDSDSTTPAAATTTKTVSLQQDLAATAPIDYTLLLQQPPLIQQSSVVSVNDKDTNVQASASVAAESTSSRASASSSAPAAAATSSSIKSSSIIITPATAKHARTDSADVDMLPVSSPSPSPQTSITSSPSPPSMSPSPSIPFGDPKDRPFAGQEQETIKVRWIYRAVTFLTDLFFGVDKDLDHLPQKRKSIQPSKEKWIATQSLTPVPSVLPPHISAGYGELPWQGFDKILYWMSHDAPDFARLDSQSRFLDIGSGFGKCVFHAKMRCRVQRSIGIECIKTRHEKAREALHLLKAGFVPGLSDAKDAPSFEQVRDIDLEGCELFEGDISVQKFHPLVAAATHIYAFDVVFSRETHAKILPLVEQSNFLLFGCYLNPQKLASFGCTQFHLLHTIKVHTTGKQSFTCYMYMKKERVENKYTRHNDPSTDAFWHQIREDTKEPETVVEEHEPKRNGHPHKTVSEPASKKKKESQPRKSASTSATARTKSTAASASTTSSSSKSKASDSKSKSKSATAAANGNGKKRAHPSSKKKKTAVSSSSSDDSDSSSEDELLLPQAVVRTKKLTPSARFDMSSILASKFKSGPRKTNNSIAVKLDPIKVLPKMLDKYLDDPVKEEEPLGLTDDSPPAGSNTTTAPAAAAASSSTPVAASLSSASSDKTKENDDQPNQPNHKKMKLETK